MESTGRRSNARRSLPIPTKRTSSAHRSLDSSPRKSSDSRDLATSRPNSYTGIAADSQRNEPATSSRSSIAKPPPSSTSKSSIGRPSSKPYSSRRTDSVVNQSLKLLPVPSSSQHRYGPSTSAATTSPTKAYGFLTPASAVSRSSAREGAIPTTPKGPRQGFKVDSNTTVPTQTPSKKAASPYLNTHIADPCIPGCLIHQLSPCGHKIMTSKPDPCASNCRRPLSQQATSSFANILQSTEAFVCAACVEFSVQTHREMKRALFREQMDRTELQMGAFLPGWREEQCEYWERVWENDVQAERAQFEKLGRKCHHIPGEPIRDGEAQMPPTYSSAPSPWPPSKRPLASRVDKKDGMAAPGASTLEKG